MSVEKTSAARGCKQKQEGRVRTHSPPTTIRTTKAQSHGLPRASAAEGVAAEQWSAAAPNDVITCASSTREVAGPAYTSPAGPEIVCARWTLLVAQSAYPTSPPNGTGRRRSGRCC